MNKHYIIGIDEAGRGAWAWPIIAGWFMIEQSWFVWINSIIPNIKDSKKLKRKERENIFSTIEYLSHKSEYQFTFAYRDAEVIDEIGIREANRSCMEDIILSFLQYIEAWDTVEIWIDGCDNYTFALEDFEYRFAQKKKKRTRGESVDKQLIEENKLWKERSISYLINGDNLHPLISLGWIIAKVVRDRIMCEYSEDFPQYSFDEHVGYGTRKHSDALHNYNITPIHRKSYAPVKRLISGVSSI